MNQTRFLGKTDYLTEWCDSSIVILPVPFDLTSSWQKGADKGPEAILAVSPNLEFYDIETDSEVYKRGIYTTAPVEARSSESMVQQVCSAAQDQLAKNKFLVTIGGEHSVSIGAVKAHVESFNHLSVLQLDAHSDLRNEYNGSSLNHACVMARIKEMCPIVQAGIRSMDFEEKKAIERDRIVFAHEMQDSDNWIDRIVNQLSNEVYITIDLDVFDSGIMPSTGTPEPGGLSWYQVLKILKAVTEKRTVVGFDVVELCPIAGNKAPDFMAAKLIYSLLSYIWR